MNKIYMILAVLIIILIIFYSMLKLMNIRLFSNILILFIVVLTTLEISMINGHKKFIINNTAENIYVKELSQKYLSYEINNSNLVSNYKSLMETANNLSGFMPVNSNVQILENGAKTFELLFNEIDKAEHHIHIQDFILRDDIIGSEFLNLLNKKVKQGVKVRIIIDGAGTSSAFVRNLKASGVEFVVENPLIKSIIMGTFNNRDHRKIFIIDGKIAYTGGLNIGDEYLGKNPNIGFWRDTDIRIEGEVAKQLQCIFLGSWYLNKKEKIDSRDYFPKTKSKYIQIAQSVNSLPNGISNAIEQIFINMINNANKSIYIVTPYLILNKNTKIALESALSKGVSIKIIFPSYSDNHFVNRTSHVYGEKLAATNVEVYEYTKGFTHSKILIVDERLASIGTANFNNRSMNLDKENTLLIYDASVVNTIVDQFKQDIKDSKLINISNSSKKNIINRLIDKICILFSPIQ